MPSAPTRPLKCWNGIGSYPEAQACERGAPEPTSVAVGTGFRCVVLLPHVGGRREDANLDCHFGLCAGGDRGKRRDLEAPFYEAARIDPSFRYEIMVWENPPAADDGVAPARHFLANHQVTD